MTGVGYFNKPSPEVDNFVSENGLEVTFGSTLQTLKPQMPSSVIYIHLVVACRAGHLLYYFHTTKMLFFTLLFSEFFTGGRVF